MTQPRVEKIEYTQEWLDIKVVSGKDDLEKHLLVDCDELLVPLGDVGRAFTRVVVVGGVRWRQRVATVVLAVLENLARCRVISVLSWRAQ